MDYSPPDEPDASDNVVPFPGEPDTEDPQVYHALITGKRSHELCFECADGFILIMP